jgi:transcriptional regulator with XRE-family HTH domain
VITNLETRRRKTREITLDELLVLAHVLDVPPLQLVVPRNDGEELEVVPGVLLGALDAADWIVGERVPTGLDDIGNPAPGAVGPPAGWQERVARIAGREILRHRSRRKLSAPQLADRTAALGMPVTRSVLADLESGTRDTVTVAEVLVIAAALGVAPTELICPVGFDEQIELLPGRTMDPLQAWKWIYGEFTLDVTDGDTRLAETDGSIEGESNMRLANEYDNLVDDVRFSWAVAERDMDLAAAEALRAAAAERQPADVAEVRLAAGTLLGDAMGGTPRMVEVASRQLRYVRAEMRRRGMLVPDLPPDLKLASDDKAAGSPQSSTATGPGNVGGH